MKKTLILLAVISIFLFFTTFYKIKSIKNKRSLKVITISSEWTEHGKPVDVLKLIKKDFYDYTKISGVFNKNKIICFVPVAIKNVIKTGSSFYTDTNISGFVESVSSYSDPNNGLYAVVLKPEKNNISNNSIVTSYINTKNIKNVLSIPNSSIIKKDSETYVFKLEKDTAKLTKIKISDTNIFNYSIVQEGLSQGSYIVTRGNEVLENNEAVRIHREF